ncbi:hypothetical protein JCM3770_000394 [Rhodotorula araucariae]
MLRLSSYSQSATTSNGYPKSPLAAAPAPPTEAFPPAPAAKSSDVLINRSHQLKRIAKGVAGFYQGIAEAHNSHALALRKLSHPSTTPIPTPFQEAALFIPLPAAPTTPQSPSTPASLGGNGSEGWAQILQEARDTNARTADAHADLAKRITKDVVGPLMRCRIDIKAHIQVMERDLTKAVDAVQKERDTAAPLLARLATSLTQSSLPAAAPSLTPAEDPVLLRAQVEGQLRVQVARENDLLAAVKTWVERTEQKEKDILTEIKRCWALWEQANSNMLLGNQQLSMFLSATVDSVPPEAEWAHFLRLNHVVLPDVAEKTLDDVLWAGKGDPLTTVVLEGMLERQTSFLRSWKPAYFILTPSGHLHIYGPPPASAVPAAPSSTDADTETDSASPSAYPPLSPTASYLLLHTSPHLSLNLALCTLGPMPTPSKTLPEAEERKKAPLDPVFTIIESLGKGGKGDGSGTKHVIRCKGEKGWEEMGGWVAAIGKFCATPTAPPPPSPPTPVAPAPSTFAASAPAPPSPSPSSSSDAQPRLTAPRTLPPPFSPPLPERAAAEESALPSLPTSPLSAASSAAAAAPPPLPPRESMLSTASGASYDADEGDGDGYGDGDGDTTRNSVLVIEDDYDLSRAMSGLGVMGALGDDPAAAPAPALGLGLGVGAELPVAPEGEDEDEREEQEQEQGQGQEDESGSSSDAGDLGRSLSGSSLTRAAFGADAAAVGASGAAVVARKERSPRQGSVRSLAAAWEQQQKVLPSSVAAKTDGEGEGEGEGAEDEAKGDEDDEDKPVVGKGKKGKKKRKSKGGAAANKPTERPLPLPSVDPEHADLGLPSPHSPTFGAAPAPLEVEHADADADADRRDSETVASPPPMVLEEVDESPSRGSADGGALAEEHEAEGEGHPEERAKVEA